MNLRLPSNFINKKTGLSKKLIQNDSKGFAFDFLLEAQSPSSERRSHADSNVLFLIRTCSDSK